MFRYFFKRVNDFVNNFLNHSGIHGFVYLGNTFVLHIFEKFFWLGLICGALYLTIHFSLESWDRYLHKNIVVSIERDHYYWNTSLPSFTVCPMERLNRNIYNKYIQMHDLTHDEKEELFDFLESLANSTYINFQNIKNTSNTDNILKKLNISSSTYLNLIYNLTEDLTIRKMKYLENKMKYEYLKVTQVLTEYGLCYVTNNFLANNLSTSFLLENKISELHSSFDGKLVHDVVSANIFDGRTSFNLLGFPSPITVFMHSAYETMNIARTYGYINETFEFTTHSSEIITTDTLKEDTSISQRNCRFHSESNLTHFKVYTKYLCMSECRLNIALDLCGCIPWFYFNEVSNPKPICSYHQLKTCFPNKKELFLEFKNPQSSKKERKFECFCLQNCINSFVVVDEAKPMLLRQYLNGIGILSATEKYPQLRYIREEIFTLTDFFVSVGATAGLFLGLSVLGFIEIFYYFSIRLFLFITE
ncbi:CLUMA_CG015089, isoform A [Clunio marinus]|uniref:CLUMA_CG015089, isoform A n=1 Tax=Clunio marinus TaxID=568069 RepID=A0A1J1IRQ3_9DIPT|nr:CLUMA_CG015089, isoform A [Clunio marinus]